MQLNSDGKLARLYRWTYNDDCPDDLCTFFWKLLFAIAIFPVTWISYPFRLRAAGAIMRIAVSIVCWLALLVFIVAPIVNALQGNLVPVFVMAGVFVGVGLLIGGCYWWEEWGEDWWYKRRPIQETTFGEFVSILSERKRSFKDKYCPRIEWR